MICDKCKEPIKQSRTTTQNRALHKYFAMISTELNEMGTEFNYTGLKGMELSTRYTPTIVKDFFWRPIQLALFDIESTTKLDSKQMNDIIDVISKFFSEKGINLPFPSLDE